MTTVTSAPMRALTVRQPWADAIARGGKTVENRTWPAPARHVGTRFLIHAAAAPDRHAVLPLEVIAAGGSDVYLDHRSAIVAVATLAGCHFDAGCCGMWGEREVFHCSWPTSCRWPSRWRRRARSGSGRPGTTCWRPSGRRSGR